MFGFSGVRIIQIVLNMYTENTLIYVNLNNGWGWDYGV